MGRWLLLFESIGLGPDGMKKKIKELGRTVLGLRSLQIRIFLLFIIIGLVPSLLIGRGVIRNYEQRAVEQRIAAVQNQLMIVANHLISNNYITTYPSPDQKYSASEEVIEAELEMLANLYEGRVMIIGGNCKVIKDTYGISEGKTIISEAVIKCFKGQNTSRYDREHGYIEMTTPIVSTTERNPDNAEGAQPVIQGVMLTSISNESIVSTADFLNQKMAVMEILVGVVVLLVASLLAMWLMRPLHRMSKSLNEVQAGYSQESIAAREYRETAQIAEAFNQLLVRMRNLDDSRQEFVANVSHELKTPMASLKVLADSLLNQEDLPVELYREFMEDMVSEIDRENQIITDLLALVRMDKKNQELSLASININDLVELILKRLRPLARKKDVEVVFESIRQVAAVVDEVKLSLVITNLVENAIKYNKNQGWVKVVLDADHQDFILEVSDSGAGIPDEALPHIYERFYRVDKSHSREIGGTGLGLAIAKNAVLMHRGSITVSSQEGQGTTFVVRIPLSHVIG